MKSLPFLPTRSGVSAKIGPGESSLIATATIKIIGEKTKIERMDLFQFSSDVSVSVEDISVNSLSIYRYRNEKALRFSNLKIYKTNQISEFSIVESYLGKTEFYSIDFGAFYSVKILDSHLVDCVFVNTKWPTKIDALKGRYISMSDKETAFPIKLERLEKRLYENINEKNLLENDPEIITYYEKKIEVLRQLKFSLGKQGDIINEQKFHSLEMVTYDKTLTWDNNFWTKSIIKFSYYFSDFGQSISQPLIGLLAIHFMFFAILVLCRVFPNFQFSIENPDATGFWNGFYEYFRLINPFRKADDTFKGGFISIDLLMRIWSSYMIYNIIRASRRFLK